MIWLSEKINCKFHEKLLEELKTKAELSEPNSIYFGKSSSGTHEIHFIHDLENEDEFLENVMKLFNERRLVEMVKDCDDITIICNLGSPFELPTFIFAIVRPAEKIQKVLEELLFDLITYGELWLLDLLVDKEYVVSIKDPLQIYTDKEVLSKVISILFKVNRINDVATLETRVIDADP